MDEYIPSVIYIPIALAVVCAGLLVDSKRVNKIRTQVALKAREDYYKRLAEQSFKMDQKKQEEEENIVQKIAALKQEGDKIKLEIEKESLQHGIGCDLSSWGDDSDSEDENPTQQLSDLEHKSDELQKVERDVDGLCLKLGDESLNGLDNQDLLRKLNERVMELQAENESLHNQINKLDCPLPSLGKKLDDELLKYLNEHEDLTLDFLKQAYGTLLDIKANNPNLDFEEYTTELKERQSSYITELTKLRVAKRQVEIQIKEKKEEYSKEISSFSEKRVEYILKNCSASADLQLLREKNKINQEYIDSLKQKLEAKRAEVVRLQERYRKAEEESREAEEECNTRYQFWKENELKCQQFDTERRLQRDQDRDQLQPFNMSSASSMMDNHIPPPPQIEIPPMDEILGSPDFNDKHETQSNPYSISMYQSYMPPPPPPPVDLSFGQQQQTSATNSIASQRHGSFA